MSTLAIDIGGTKFTVGLFDEAGGAVTMIRRESHATDREGGRDWMLSRLDAIVADWVRGSSITRCGIGFGGPVDFERQRVALSTHVGGWTDFPLCDHISQLLSGVPVVMDNDANAGALGEAMHGAGSAAGGGYARPLLYLTISTGIGGGIVIGDEVYRGADSWAGEIGHITIHPGGPECLCGSHGCLERLCCGLWLERDYGKTAKELFLDETFVSRYVVDFAQGLKAAIMLLNPAAIVLGGGIAKAGDRLFVPLRAELRRQVTSWSRARLDIRQAALGDDSVLWGAFELARRRG
ncbi:MAG: ROK family protein [Bryobacteraceae bacterium]